MKTGIISIILATIGIIFVIWFNLEVVELYKSETLKMANQTDLSPRLFVTGKTHKIIAIVIALIGMILGIKSLRDNNRIGTIGLILSIILIILTLLPIWSVMF